MFKRSAIISHDSSSAKWQQGLPVLALLFAASMWGISWYPIRYLEDSGINALWVSPFIYVGSLVMALPFIVKHHGEFIKNRRPLLAIALLIGWVNISFILAVLDGQVVRVLLLFYLSPVWASLLSWLVLKEALHVKEWLMIAIAITGALIMLWSPELGLPVPQSVPDWMALSSGFCFAFANMMIRKTSQVSIGVKTVSGWLGVLFVSLLLIVITGKAPGELNLVNVSLAVLYGMAGMTLMTTAVVYGVSHMPLYRSSVILLFEIIIGAVSAVWLAHESIMPREWIGGVLVILAAYLSAKLEMKNESH